MEPPHGPRAPGLTRVAGPSQDPSDRAGLVARVPSVVGAGVVIALLAALWVHLTAAWRAFRFDDVYITLRYAENLARHGHLSFNLDDRVDGYTSTGWTLILAVAIACGLDGESAALYGGWLAGLLAALVAVALARRLGAHPALAVAIAGVGTLYTPGYAPWSVCGMDTAYAGLAAVVTVLAWVTPVEGAAGRYVPRVRAVAAVVCATARPELIVLTAGLLAGELWAHRPSRGSRGWSAASWRASWPALRPYAVAVAVLAMLFVLHWGYYGHPLGNTYYAKRGTDGMTVRGLGDLRAFLMGSELWPAPLAALLLAMGRDDRARARVAAAFGVWFVATGWVYARAGGDYVGFGRFYQPLVPCSTAVLAAVVGLALRASERGDGSTSALRRHAAAVVIACAIGGWFYWSRDAFNAMAYGMDMGSIRQQSEYTVQWRRVADVLRRAYPRGTTLAVRAAGLIPYATGFRTVDFLGVNNPEVAHDAVPHDDIPGHQREATPKQMVVRWHPDVVVWHPHIVGSDLSGHPSADFSATTYRAADYRYHCLPMGGGEWVCVWERAGLRGPS